ncbi:MAG: hypothetical protein AAGA83_00270 [Cyanobacteria bacterium P01_F01_bin.116]
MKTKTSKRCEQKFLFNPEEHTNSAQSELSIWGNHTGLINPYPGSKRNFNKYPIWDGRQYDFIVEPCVGSGHFTTWALSNGIVKKAFVADNNYGVHGVWETWTDNEYRKRVWKAINQLIGKNFRDKSWATAQNAFAFLKDAIDSYHPENIASNHLDFIVATIVIRRLIFGSFLRNNTKGLLNVCLSQDKFQSIQNWHFQWPWLPDNSQIIIEDDALKLCDRINAESIGMTRGLCLFDPPYWVPQAPGTERRGTGAMTPAYPDHLPSEGALFDFTIKVLDKLLSSRKIGRVVFTNYINDRLCDAVQQLADKHNQKYWFKDLGPLQRSNNYAETRTDPFREGWWEFGGNQMHGKFNEMSLLSE